ncbi:DUF72 domain-containing protein [Phenylobacterium sp.]|jgi:uncharacterized protein YecE (DUF72 family)|uniref:DUF72 domain-containing protein n=1 Tax=Phenylobacterium sp. TaxID=1871053 RepID=UPI002F93CCBA
MSRIRIGTAGWAVPRTLRDRFPEGPSGLARYAGCFDAAEVNSSFYRSHRESTWRRWAAETPEGFRFAVKAPRTATHERKLVDTGALIDPFLAEARLLGDRLGPILVQLPPSLAFDPGVAECFLAELRARFDGPVACEPRHPTWFEPEADALLRRHRVARVAADPLRHPAAGAPGGWPAFAYWRLHGSPRMYYSAYEEPYLRALAAALRASPADEVWCVFDNTTSGAAAENALSLRELVDD